MILSFSHLCPKRLDGLIRRRLERIVDLDLQNKLGSALKIQAQPDLLLHTLHAGRKARKQEDRKDGNAKNDEDRVRILLFMMVWFALDRDSEAR